MTNHGSPVPDWLNSEYVETILKNSLSPEGLHVTKIEVSAGSEEGDNCLGQIFRIVAHCKNNNNKKKISVIGKYKAQSEFLDKAEKIIDIFGTEANFYKDMPPLFKKVLNQADIDFLPICHFLDSDKNLIVLEDLVTSNYKMQTRQTFLNIKQCTLVIEGLAIMHGASYKALQIKPELRNKFQKTMFQVKEGNPVELIIYNKIKYISKYVKMYGLTQKHEDEILKLKSKLDSDWFKICDFKEDHLNFLCHGDCWMNNMMFHTNGNKMKFIDFQVYNYNCFANDLQYFLFTSAEADVIVNNVDYLIETYYKKLHSVAPEIPSLTLERVMKEFSERYFFGFILSFVFRPGMVCFPPPDMKKIMEGEETPAGLDCESYVKELPKLMEFFDKVGVF